MEASLWAYHAHQVRLLCKSIHITSSNEWVARNHAAWVSKTCMAVLPARPSVLPAPQCGSIDPAWQCGMFVLWLGSAQTDVGSLLSTAAAAGADAAGVSYCVKVSSHTQGAPASATATPGAQQATNSTAGRNSGTAPRSGRRSAGAPAALQDGGQAPAPAAGGGSAPGAAAAPAASMGGFSLDAALVLLNNLLNITSRNDTGTGEAHCVTHVNWLTHVLCSSKLYRSSCAAAPCSSCIG